MKKLSIVLFIIPVFLAGCDKENGMIPTSGEATLDSRLYFNEKTQNYYTKGFSFAKGKVVNYERFVSAADILVRPLEDTEIVGVYMESPDNDEAFKRMEQFDLAEDAAAFFNNLKLITVTLFDYWANPIGENEIYAFQTIDQKYAKIWIKTIEIFNDLPDSYVQVTFQWEYQPDGTKVFD